jgi:hypothetical protein
VVIFKSSQLFHGITTWKPKGGIDVNGILPGRRAHVLYTKSAAFEKLRRELPGSLRKNNDGMDQDWNVHEHRPIAPHPLYQSQSPAYQKLRSLVGSGKVPKETPDLCVKYRHE